MIRDLKPKDIDKVMEIWLESTIKAHDFIPKKYWQDNFNAVKDIYIPQSKTYVYEEGKDIKGFISILNDDFIGALFVSPNEQGKGIGSKLIEYVNNKFDNLKLAVYKQNQRSVHFYIKKGFEILSEE
ncbi:MAG: N-acetyltransferase, partial [Intestinibacter bartlettii]|uniref:N-acetyltransferase n=1 Tax=Intestinibacter bartlettii TaxID=261299 RepID=UPI0026EA112D